MMTSRLSRPFSARRAAMLGAMLLAGTAWPALAAEAAPGTDAEPAAAEAAPAAQQDAPPADEDAIVVTGYRASLESAGKAKREAIGFSESVFAEDIGKFPDTNLAESFNRVPGVTISREITGEGLNIAIRGLGTNFTRILLNGAPVAIASTGRTDSQNTNREVDLDLFPSELFTQLTVNKSPLASMIEGGAAGTVNMRSARPFDHAGTRITYSGQLTNNSNTSKWGYRGSVIGSFTSGDIGVLVGVAGVHNQVRTTGFETIGWTNANLSATQNTGTRNNTGGGNWTIPGTVPANAGNGLVTGATIDQAFLLAQNPGLTIQQIDNALIPRLGRPSDEFGTKDRISGVASFEWRPSDDFHFYVDSMYGHRKNDLQRIDMNWIGRNGNAIPINMKVDRSDCSNGCVVTEATFANAQFFLEYRPFIETTKFWGVNPGFDARLGDSIKIDVQGNYTKSQFHRESPTVLVVTPPRSGTTVTYKNDGVLPSIVSNVDLNNPASFGWPSNTAAAGEGGRVNIQDERRQTITKGIRGNLEWDAVDGINFRTGAAYDDVSRRIRAFDNSPAWQNAVCGNQPNVYIPGNRQPFCNGLNVPGGAQAEDPNYPAYGTGFTAGATGPVRYLGSLIPQSSVASYLMPGPDGFVTVDWDKFKTASQYDAFHDAAPEATSSNTSANAGYVRERVLGAYLETNATKDVFGRELRINAGVRYVHTKQTIGGFVSIADVRNPPAVNRPAADPFDGSRYPNALKFVYTDSSYSEWLPSLNMAYSIIPNGLIRFSASKTMTRPNPNVMLPGLNFSSPSADTGTRGNPDLGPFLSSNLDLGAEYYLKGGGYIALAGFKKSIIGFTGNGTITVPFSSLAQYGVTFDTLSATQQGAINLRGGPTVAQVQITQQVNAGGALKVKGLEGTISLPLDFILGNIGLDGFGFFANGTYVDQHGTGAAPAVAVGVSKYTYNASFYYEAHGLSARISTTWAQGSQQSLGGQNGIANAALFSDDYQQWDFSSSLDLEKIFGTKNLPQLTFDVQNIGKAQQRSYFQYTNATFTLYQPGRQVMVGLRGRF
jgi:TonB-dependent receptor